MPEQPPLKLQAREKDDIVTISALLQDALVAGHDMQYLAADKSFVFLANRYCWERADDASASCGTRRLCGVNIGRVTDVKRRGLSADSGQFYNLLAIEYESADKRLVLTFSGGGAVRLDVADLHVIVADVANAHPSFARPEHDHDD